MLLSMSSCAELYLGDSDYGHCQEYLKNAVANSELNSSPAVIYCTFLECVRQVNKDSLVNINQIRYYLFAYGFLFISFFFFLQFGFHFVRRAIQTCIRESLDMFDNFTASDMKLAQLVVNTTACILAKTRCGSMNPITGAYKASNTSTKYSIIPTINAILVNTDYNINIIQMPFGHGVIDECAKYRNIEQASWPNLQC
ncbi:GSCOCG00000725001-RA-CDS [Cotesia congregata]|nr:GSCOCG00000725001-RA-CDS [Cotesia congregata]